MRYNGLQLVIRLALQKIKSPLFTRYGDALILGTIRENVVFLRAPGWRGKISTHLSLSHFSGDWLGGGFLPLIYPGAPRQAQRYFDRAVAQWRGGERARAMMNLGRASHLLTDMACPVHARRVAHFTDGYEWYIDGNYERLKALEFGVKDYAGASVREIVRGMARFTQGFEPDRTNHHFGRLLRRWGMRRGLTRQDFERQAAQILPEAATRLHAIYAQFISKVEPA